MQIESPTVPGWQGTKLCAFAAWIIASFLVLLLCILTLSCEDARAIAIVAFAILGWSFQPGKMPIEYTSMAFLALIILTGAMPWPEAWRGMSSEGIWLIFCGMAMSLSLTETRISLRIAQSLCWKQPSWPWMLLRLNVVGGLLALCVPSQVVRCQLVVPIARSTIDHMKLEPLSRRASAVFIALVVSTNHCGAAVLTGGLPNIIAVSALQQCGIQVSWGFWFLRMAPVFWSLSIFGNSLVLLLLTWRTEPHEPSEQSEQEAPQRLSFKEKGILGVFAVSMAMWATDVLHHIHPTTVSLLAVLILFCPAFSFMPFEKLKLLNFPLIIYVASLEALAPLLKAAPRAGPAVSAAAEAAVSPAPQGVLRFAALLRGHRFISTLSISINLSSLESF